MTPEKGTRKRLTGTALGLAATAGAVLCLPGTASGDVVDLSYTATAAADPIRISTKMANFPATDTPVDSGGPSAQALLSTSTGGQAYSAAPDPGVFLTVLPQLGKGVLEQNGAALPFAAPPYPFAIQANDQEPSKQVGAGGYELAADVTPTQAQARTKTGGQSPGGNVALVDAAAEVVESSDGVAAKAISDIQGLTIGPLTLGSVRSVVSVLADSTGFLTRNSTFAVDGVRIGALPVGLAPGGGFTAFGQPVQGDQAATFNNLLAAGGVTLESFPQTQTEHGLIGAGLIITHKFDAPSLGATTIRYRIGGAAVDLNAGGSSAIAAEGSSTSGASGAAESPSAPGGVVALPVPGVDAAALPGLIPAGAAAGPSPAGAGSAGLVGTQLVQASTAPLVGRVNGGLYLAVVLAGVLGFGVTRVMRIGQVK